MLCESTQQSLYKSIEKALLCVGNVGSKTELTSTEHECLCDAVYGIGLSKTAYDQWVEIWTREFAECWPVRYLTEDSKEYATTVKFIANWIEENYYD